MKLIILTFALFGLACYSSAKTRTYYVAVLEVFWDYAPSGFNQKTLKPLNEDPNAFKFTNKTTSRIGKVYKKAVYREFTNSSFTEQKPRDNKMGILGPVLKGQLGDVIHIYFKNLASRGYTMHPHTVFYSKASEGALYSDSSYGKTKADDSVAPGNVQEYIWVVTKEGTPAEGDPNCLTWLYHSHIIPTKDMNSGPVGMIETCKRGILNEDGTRKDVQKEFYMIFHVLDENESWYLDENMRNSGIDPMNFNKADKSFKESNMMYAVNGRIYANLDLFEVCQGDNVAWHMSVLGNEVDIHTIVFMGNSLISDHHRTDFLTLFPAHSGTVLMHANNPGKWMIGCRIDTHRKGGMFTSYYVNSTCGNKTDQQQLGGKVRRYFITAEETAWNYGPTGYNSYDGESLNKTDSSSSMFFLRGPNRIGGSYLKARFFEYTDETFTVKKLRSMKDEKHLGLLGPIIKAEVGDVLQVAFRNMLNFQTSIHPRGVFYNKSNEGLRYNDFTEEHADSSVPPNVTYTYQWTVPESVAPTDKDTPCIAWLYTSGVKPVAAAHTGLVGPLITCKRGSLQDNGIPRGYAAEKFLLVAVMDENKSRYLDRNMERFCTSPKCANVAKDDEEFQESNKMHQINGFMFGDLGIEMCKGDKVLFYGFGIGDEMDIHGISFSGNGIEVDGNNKDSVMIFPGGSTTFSMEADNDGIWSMVCKVNDHYQTGMKYTYKVNKCMGSNDSFFAGAERRRYYIGIKEVDWDYAPNNMQMTSGEELTNDTNAIVFTQRSTGRIGKVYKKAMFVEYEDERFLKQKPVTERTRHLGILGPFIRAEEGDEIIVVAKNMASRSYSINPHGLLYSKDNEGAKYQDATNHKGSSISPGDTYTYHWFVPKRAAPGPNDGPCITWAYYSSVDPIKDTNSGLIGPLITCRKGTLKDGRRKDVDREFAILFSVMDENESWYLEQNINKYVLQSRSVDKTNSDFKESNKMHAINGYIYSNGPNHGGQFQMYVGEKVAWYVIGFGNEVDIHTVHFHGNSFIHRTNSKHVDDVYDIFPGIFSTLEMTPVNSGKWLLHCHVNDHKRTGMETIFEVKRKLMWGQSSATLAKGGLWLLIPSLLYFMIL